jgi:cob(I)alamin adenosyltransferase
MTTRIYTKTGDDGETGLWGGTRVMKDHLRVETYGTLDELNAVLGWAQCAPLPPAIHALVTHIQSSLFELGSELATPSEHKSSFPRILKSDIVFLEQNIDVLEKDLPPLTQFILPSGSEGGCRLHMARAVCRRAERRLVTLCRADTGVRQECIHYLNRLADALFVMARWVNHAQGAVETPWTAKT